MHNKFYLLLFVSFLGLLGCKTKLEDPLIIPLPTPAESTRTMPDSIATYQPAFATAGTVRQFPFGSANRPATGLRLKTVLLNGKRWRTYDYDPLGRLTKRTDYYTDGEHIYTQFTYRYTDSGIGEVTTALNKEAPYVEGVPQTNELLPSRTIGYSAVDKDISELAKTTNTVFIDWSQKTGQSQSRMGFDRMGALVWDGTVGEQGQRVEGTVYRRDATGNVSWLRSTNSTGYWDIHYFSYDNKPNPYRTTGDPQQVYMTDLLSANATNLNNVVAMQSVNSLSGDGWRYDYTYRSDGYPSVMKAYRSGALERTIEYLYQ